MRRSTPKPERGRRALPLALGVAALLVLAAVPVADAYRFAGDRWPNKTISVANRAPLYEPAVRAAIRAWNSARVGVRFVRAPAGRARVVFKYSPGGGGPSGCEGIAGGTGGGYPSPFIQPMDVRVIKRCRLPRLRRLTAAHELGHVLGLGHEDRRCALMNSVGSIATQLPSRCAPGGPASRRLVLPDDVAGARALYRRKPKPVDGSVALFNPGNGTSIPFDTGSVDFAASFVNRGLDYRWDFGDAASGANSARGLEARHTFSGPGTYTVTLTVFDGGAQIARSRQTLTLF